MWRVPTTTKRSFAAAFAVAGISFSQGFASSSTALTTTKYGQLTEKLTEIEKLAGIKGLLGWDEMVLLAPGSATARNDQKSALSGIMYEKQTSPDLAKLITDLKTSALSELPTNYERAVVRDAARDYDLTVRKSKDMTIREAELEGRGYQTWAAARGESNFQQFAPVLKEIVALKREIAAVTHPELSAYAGNIDAFERGMTVERLNEIFTVTKRELVPLIQKICKSPVKSNDVVPPPLVGQTAFTVDKQKEMCSEVAKDIGFDFNKGRLDVSVHPFTGGSHPTDVRITTRYSSDNWLQGVAGTVHEVGHALYEQGRNPKYDNLPVSRALSMGVHESQSLLWERMVFQSKEFWQYATPLLHKHFPHTKDMTSDQLYKFVNRVEPGLIRVDADEVTYPMHIILRFELEQALFAPTDKALDVNDLPAEWSRRMKDSLGVDVPNDAKGPLQDIHWSIGALGYFPSYTLGAMMAAQLFETAEKAIPDLRNKIAKGEFQPLREWLRTNVHETGSLYASPDELLVAVTGKPLDPTIYITYLQKKYTELYNL